MITSVLVIVIFTLSISFPRFIHKHNYFIYIISAIIAIIFSGEEANIITLGYVPLSFMIVVMYTGVFQRGFIKKRLMTVRAVSRSLEQKETAIHELMHKTMKGTLVIVNGTVDRLSLSIEGVESSGSPKPRRVTVLNMEMDKAKSLYLLLRSMLKITGDLEELDECVL